MSPLPERMSLSLLSFRPAIATTAGRRTQDSPCRANLNAASAVLELPKDVEVPKEVAAIFQKLQNGSDIRGIAIAGKSILESTTSVPVLLATCSSLHYYAGVDGEEQNITPTVAFFIGVGFASWLSETLKMPANSLHISVKQFQTICAAPLPEACC